MRSVVAALHYRCDQVIESRAIQVNDESVVESRARQAAPGRRARNESDD